MGEGYTRSLCNKILGLKIEVYDPVVHYHRVGDAWASLRA
jgi:hypothetical protein